MNISPIKEKMNRNNKKLKLVTHNGSFHADDIFATATLSLMLGKEGKKFEIIRTRDEGMIKKGDFVYDVGGIYNPNKNRFDHHQKTFKERRKNGIIYSSFGLIWKKYGKKITSNEEIKDRIDKKIIQPIDAGDNGQDLYKLNLDVKPYLISSLFHAFRPTWKEKDDFDKPFLEMVKIAKKILDREIKREIDNFEGEKKFLKIYKSSKDKRLIILDGKYPIPDSVIDLKTLFVVSLRSDGNWAVNTISKSLGSFRNKKDLPKVWGGLRDKELQKITGVRDAIFCHKGLFLAVAKSKTGAIKLAELALAKKN